MLEAFIRLLIYYLNHWTIPLLTWIIFSLCNAFVRGLLFWEMSISWAQKYYSLAHWSSLILPWTIFLPPVGVGLFSLHCKLPLMRLLPTNTPLVFWNACKSAPILLFCADREPEFDSSCKLPLIVFPIMVAAFPCLIWILQKWRCTTMEQFR